MSNRKLTSVISIALISLFVVSCSRQIPPDFPHDEGEEFTEAITGDATHVTCCNAEISGKAHLPKNMSTGITLGIRYFINGEEDTIQIEASSFDSEYNYSINIGGLEPETTYHYYSCLYYDGGIVCGKVKSFTTPAVSSMIQTLDATDINYKDAVLNASLDLTDCRYDALEYGFEVASEGSSAHTVKSSNYSEKKFSVKDEFLTRDTKYSVVAYVKLDDRTYKGEVKELTTKSIQASITAESSDVSSHSATISGRLTVESEGSFAKSAAVYYSSTASTQEALKSSGIKKTLTLDLDGSYSINLSPLACNTQYNFVVVSKVDDAEFASSVKSLTTLDYQTPNLVDLGLSVMWASFNLDASKPEDYGGYYQWAGTTDVTDKSIYIDWSNCPYHTGSSSSTGWTKYVRSYNSSYWSGTGSPDHKTVLDPEDDVAHVKLGGKWRMPTRAEWDELMDYCSSEWTTLNGVKGRKFTSKKNGNSIFLPAAGCRYCDCLDEAGSRGLYWSSSLNTNYPFYAYYMSFNSDRVFTYTYDYRCYGLSVRPVSELLLSAKTF